MRVPALSEQWLRHFWEHRSDTLRSPRTTGGEPITILSPGTPNYDSGPDFREALIRIGGIAFRGDVEVHVHAGEWAAHRHHLDARYNSVVLHVAVRAGPVPALTASGRELPLLLVPPLEQTQIPGTDPPPPSRAEPPPLHCPHPFPCDRTALLRRLSLLGMERMGKKVRRLEERLSDLETECARGEAPALWGQLLYEGILEGLGYSKNRAPFLRLARTLGLADLRAIGLDDREGVMAALFGTAGLLPSPRQVEEAESRRYVRRLRHRWKTLHPVLHVQVLHETSWRFFRLRPANLPTARLASLAFLLPHLFGPGKIKEILSLFRGVEEPPASRLAGLRKMFLVRPDEFWARHLYFGTPQHSRGISLGQCRTDDLIVNAVLPWLFLFARKFRRQAIEQNALLLYRTFPPLQQNQVTCQVERLLTHFPLACARLHQGALEWVRRFCSRQRCDLCPLAHPVHVNGTGAEPVPSSPRLPQQVRM